MNAILKDLTALGVHERLQLVEDLWDSIAEDSLPPISDEVYEEVCRRAAWPTRIQAMAKAWSRSPRSSAFGCDALGRIQAGSTR